MKTTAHRLELPFTEDGEAVAVETELWPEE